MGRLGATLAVVLLVACGSRPDQAINQPAVLDLAQFSDLPMPPGYFLSNADDQVATAVVAGTRRYALLVYSGDTERDDLLRGSALTDWYARRLAAYGWERIGSRDWQQCEREEVLRLETGRRVYTPTIRLFLRHRSRGPG